MVLSLIVIILVIQGIILIKVTQNSLKKNIEKNIKQQAEELSFLFNYVNHNADAFELQMRKSYDLFISQQVDMPMSILKYFHEQNQKGLLSKEEAQKKAKDLIRTLRYGKNGYIWVADEQYKLLVLGTAPHKEGENWKNTQDKNGTLFIKNIVDSAVQNGKGYCNYWFPKPGTVKAYPKEAMLNIFSLGVGYQGQEIILMNLIRKNKYF